jgi:hypothetical protein
MFVLKKKLLIKLDRFGIEFAPEVVLADGSVQNLAWRICNAKKVLVSDITPVWHRNDTDPSMQAPYSMTPSRGRSTPAEMKAWCQTRRVKDEHTKQKEVIRGKLEVVLLEKRGGGHTSKVRKKTGLWT